MCTGLHEPMLAKHGSVVYPKMGNFFFRVTSAFMGDFRVSVSVPPADTVMLPGRGTGSGLIDTLSIFAIALLMEPAQTWFIQLLK